MKLDAEDFSVSPEQIEQCEARKGAKRKERARKPRTQMFSQIDRRHVELLRASDYRNQGTVWSVLTELVWPDFRSGGHPFKWSNAKAKSIGVSPAARRRALQVLADLGIIRSEAEPKKSPRITLL